MPLFLLMFLFFFVLFFFEPQKICVCALTTRHRFDEDIDDEMFQSGTVVWVKVPERPWWPCVLFKSWEEARFWGVPSPRGVDTARPLDLHEVCLCLK